MPTYREFAKLHAVYVAGGVMLLSACLQAWGLPAYAIHQQRRLRLIPGGRA